MANQRERILAHMALYGSITSLDGLMMRPPIIDVRKRISELRADGYPIEKTPEKSRDGASYNRYYMKEGAEL